MRYILDGEQMKKTDQYTISNLGVPSLYLMENAAKSCVRIIEDKSPGKEICVVCGSGNNGGDGFAISRLLLEKGYIVTTCLVGNPLKATKETNVQMARLAQINHHIHERFIPGKYDMIVDAIFGVGLCREITGKYSDVINEINQCPGKKLAVDIPSGISSDLGQVLGIAVKADYTVTFQFAKIGQILHPGKYYCGELFVEDIGIVSDPLKEKNDVCYTLDDQEFAELLPCRTENSNKGSYGRLLIIAGSKGMSGACYLNSYAAYTAGAGLVRVYTEESNRVIIQSLLPEAIVTTYTTFDEKQLASCLRWADSMCIGSGLGTSETSAKILEFTLRNFRKPTVIDADALNIISTMEYLKKELSEIPCVLTPHMKEMARLLNTEVTDLIKNRFRLVQDFVNEYNTICVLKDARTVVFKAFQSPYINFSGNQAMAKGGSGDVLCGIIGGLTAQSKDIYKASVEGVYLHGRAGDLARKEKGSYSVLARDLITYFIDAIKEKEMLKDENL